MTIGVSHSFGGTVVVVDLHSGLRFDLSPAQALTGADICEQAAERPADMHLVVIHGLDDRALKWAGAPDDLHAMARDLRMHAAGAAAKAAAKSAANDDGGQAA
jgi:hypothetical protein